MQLFHFISCLLPWFKFSRKATTFYFWPTDASNNWISPKCLLFTLVIQSWRLEQYLYWETGLGSCIILAPFKNTGSDHCLGKTAHRFTEHVVSGLTSLEIVISIAGAAARNPYNARNADTGAPSLVVENASTETSTWLWGRRPCPNCKACPRNHQPLSIISTPKNRSRWISRLSGKD